MISARPQLAAAITIAVISLVDVAIADQYHELGTETYNFLTGYSALILLISFLAVALLKAGKPLGTLAKNLTVTVAIFMWLMLVFFPRLQIRPDWISTKAGFVAIVTLCVVTLLNRFARPNLDSRIWYSLGTGAVLFVLAPTLLAYTAAPEQRWPVKSQLQPRIDLLASPAASGRHAVIFLLFDELSANAADPLIAELHRHGLKVGNQNLRPVGTSTSNVIPTMWTGKQFSNARACSMSAICTRNDVLDFGRVTASRPDIDVVGFYHPYCAMTGLRYCERAEFSPVILNMARWTCAYRKYVLQQQSASCADQNRQLWEQFRTTIEAALWKAPIWTAGGMLYAHLPLPHPPGNSHAGSIEEEYANNVSLSVQLLNRMIARLKEGRFDDFTIIIFSDHPLRASMWCATGSYSATECQNVEHLRAHSVPLIVATSNRKTIEFRPLSSNGDIFEISKQ